jgi:integrase
MNIKKDKNGTYYFVISAGFTSEGKRRQIRRTGFKTQKEAKEKYLTIQNELQQETFVDPSSVILETFIEKWKKRKKEQVEKSSFERYERLCKSHIIPAIGSMKLQKITTVTIQELIDTMAFEQGYSRKTLLMVKNLLKDIFRSAIKEGFIRDNPVQEIEFPKANKLEMIIWDQKEIDAFISIRNKKNRGKYYVAVLVALLTGMRKGEILALTWDKIDFENSVIHVQQIMESDGRTIAKRTKNKRFRQILIPDLLKEELLLHKKQQNKDTPQNPNNLVFCTYTGKTVLPFCLNDVLDYYCEKLELPRMKFHDLRHTHATMLLKQNINIKVISERLGHSKTSTTLDIYSHVLPSMQQSVTDKMNEMFQV